MFIECCISSPEYVSIKLLGLQPQRFLPALASWCLVRLKKMWKSVLTSQTDKMRHMIAKHMARVGILI